MVVAPYLCLSAEAVALLPRVVFVLLLEADSGKSLVKLVLVLDMSVPAVPFAPGIIVAAPDDNVAAPPSVDVADIS